MLTEVDNPSNRPSFVVFSNLNEPHARKLADASTSDRRIIVEWSAEGTNGCRIGVEVPLVVGQVEERDRHALGCVTHPTRDWMAPKGRLYGSYPRHSLTQFRSFDPNELMAFWLIAVSADDQRVVSRCRVVDAVIALLVAIQAAVQSPWVHRLSLHR